MRTRNNTIPSPGAHWELRCPSCDRKMRDLPVMGTATQVVRRTCQRKDCRERWQIKAVPLQKLPRGVFAAMCDWTFMGRVSANG